MKKLLFICAMLVSYKLQAEWLCKEAASKAMDNKFYACGHALEKSLIKSRENSLQAAKREFETFCKESFHCKDQAYTMSPLRTDCTKESDKYSCYRGIEYTILPQRKSSASVDKEELKRLIKIKESELIEFKENVLLVQKLESLDDGVRKGEKLDTVEVELIYLQEQLTNDYSSVKKNGVAFKILGLPTSLKKDDSKSAKNVFLGGISFEADTNVWNFISFKAGISYLFGGEQINLNDRGIPNSTSDKKFHSHKGIDFSGAMSLTFNRFRVSPTLGFMSVKYKSSQYTYNSFGIGLSKNEKSYEYNSKYVGLGLRYGGKLFIEIEPRKYLNDKKSNVLMNIGARFDF